MAARRALLSFGEGSAQRLRERSRLGGLKMMTKFDWRRGGPCCLL